MYVHDTSPSIGEHANFDFFDFSRNCELRFRSNFHHRQYSQARGGGWGEVGAGVVTKLCKWEFLVTGKKYVGKKSIFYDFLESGVEFLRCVCVILRRSSGSTEWLKIFFEFFSAKGR